MHSRCIITVIMNNDSSIGRSLCDPTPATPCDAAEDDCIGSEICGHVGPGEHECIPRPLFSAPAACSPACAVVMHEFTQRCGGALSNVFGAGDAVAPLYMETAAWAASGGASAWSNTEMTDTGSAGWVHGPWGSDTRDVTMEIEVPAGAERCTVSLADTGTVNRLRSG